MRIIALLLTMLILCSALISEEVSDNSKKEQMRYFMKLEWGSPLKGVKKHLKEVVGESTRSLGRTKVQEQDGLVTIGKRIMNNYLVVDFTIDIIFVFKNTPETIEELKEKYKKSEYQLKLAMAESENLFFHSVRIICDPDNFDDIYNLFRIKYGEPTSELKSEVHNLIGVKFQQTVATWVNKKLRRMLVLKKYGNSLTESYIAFLPLLDKDYYIKRQKYLEAAAAKF